MARKEKVTTREYTYTAVFEPAEEGGYIVSFPALPGCATQGETLDEARAMAADALQGYLQVLVAHGRPVPPERPPTKPFREPVKVALKAG